MVGIKQLLNHVLFLFISLLTIISCVKVPPKGNVSEDELLFSAYLLKEAATKLDGVVFPTNMTFGSSCWLLGAGKSWEANYSSAQLYIDKGEVFYNNLLGKWTIDPQAFWPFAGSLSFISYAPYSLTSYSGFSVDKQGVKIVGWSPGRPGAMGVDTTSTTHNTQVDIMVADFQSDLTRESALSGVPTIFRHQLSKVRFKAKFDVKPDNTSIYRKIAYVKLTNIYATGDFTYSMWGNRTNPQEYVFYDWNHDTNRLITLPHGDSSIPPTVTIGGIVTMIPQGLYGATGAGAGNREEPKLEFGYFLEGSSTINIVQVPLHTIVDQWQRNNIITYTLIFGVRDEYIDFDTDVDAWNDVGGAIIDIS